MLDSARNFAGQNLRGRSFEKQDLSGADFSYADIRGANFTCANLTGANFTGAKAGLQKQWEIRQRIGAFVVAVCVGLFAALVGRFLVFFLAPNNIERYTAIPGIAILIAFVISSLVVAVQGFTEKAGGIIARVSFEALAVTVIGTVAWTVSVAGLNLLAAIAAWSMAGFSAAITITTWAVTVTILGCLSMAVAVAWAGGGFWAIFIAVAVTVFVAKNLAVAVAVFLMFLSCYIVWRALKGEADFSLVLKFAVVFTAIGGTSFRDADLTEANFTEASLKNSDFRKANLTRTYFSKAHKSNRARLVI